MDQFVPYNFEINSVIAPASKSVAQRMLLASALSCKTVQLNNLGRCDDVLHIKSIIQQLGAHIHQNGQNLIINGNSHPITTNLNCGESGLGIRLTITIASTFGKDFTITGEGSLLKRPLKQFQDFLPQMGVDVKLTNGNSLPLQLSGKLKGGHYTVDGSLSSQYISGLLMALPLCENDSVLTVTAPTSTPYIDITLDVLKTFNIDVKNNNYTTYSIKGNQTYQPTSKIINIEGDWSGAAFWIVYGALKGQITISNLATSSTQADKAILDVIKSIGCDFKWDKNGILHIQKINLNAFSFDATHCPDLFPILVVLAAGTNGTSTIKGVKRLKHKESDRGMVLQSEFKKLGLNIEINDDMMTIYGTGTLKSGTINSNNDHRIAMAGAIASILTDKGITITNAQSVNKSYPEFWELI